MRVRLHFPRGGGFKRAISFFTVLLFTATSLLVVSPAELLAAPSVGSPIASPSSLVSNVATQLTVTTQITTAAGDPNVIKTSVYLYKLDAQNRIVRTYGPMKDDGTGGDAVANDNKFTFKGPFTETAPLRLQTSAAFERVVRRVYSPVVVVPISTNNPPPVFTSTAVTTATKQLGYLYEMTASDPNDAPETLVFSLVSGPAGAEVSGHSLTWVPADDQNGSFPVVVKVADPAGASATQSFNIAVQDLNLPPTIESVPATSARAGQEFLYDVDAFDPEGKPLRFSLQSAPPTGMTLDPATGLLRWTPGTAQTKKITVDATDPEGAFDEQSFNLTVYDGTPLQLTSPKGTYQVKAGETLTIPLQANLPKALFSADPLPDHSEVTPPSFIFKPDGGQAGTHTVLFEARAGEQHVGNVVTINVIKDAAVNAAPQLAAIPAQSVNEGASLSFVVSATDPDGDPLTFSAPGLSLPNAFFSQVTQQFIFNPSYQQAGVYPVTFQVSDGIETSQTVVAITVKDVAPPTTILKLVVDKTPNPTFNAALPITGNVTGQPGLPPPPETLRFVTGLSPAFTAAGETKQIDITATGTDFKQETTSASFGEGVAVQTLEILSPVTARATVKVDGNAASGPREVSMTDNGLDVPSLVAFSVGDGVTSVSGKVIDVFTTQPLAGAKVTINGTAFSTTTGADGKFNLVNAPTGDHTLLILRDNYTVGKVDLTLGAGQALDLADPIGLKALAVPFSLGGSLPRAATLASVLDRGVTNKNGNLTLEEARAVVQDTLLAVGGIEAGVLDESGAQLNPKIKGFGDLSLTQDGVTAQANSLIHGEVFTLEEFHSVLAGAFSFPLGFTLENFIQGLQKAVDEAWADPSNPDSAMAIVLFNEGTGLQATAPVLTAGTRLNRFQVFLLSTSFLVYNQTALANSVDEMLKANNIDADALMPPPRFPPPAGGASSGGSGGGGGLGGLGLVMLNFGMPDANAQAAPNNDSCKNTAQIPCNIGDLSARRTFTKVYRQIGANAIAEANTGGLFSAFIAMAMQAFIGFTIGMTGGVAGAVGGALVVAAAYAAGSAAILFNKLVMGWYVALVAASFEPPPPEGRNSALDDNGNYVINFNRSQAEFNQPKENPPNTLHKDLAYHLYRFPSCAPPNFGQAEFIPIEAKADPSSPQNEKDPPTGPLRFVVPKAMLKPGRNHFRIRSFQHLKNAKQPLVEGMELFDSNEDGLLTLDEFQRGGFGSHLAFNPLDKNADGKLDAAEFAKARRPDNLPQSVDLGGGLPQKNVSVAMGSIDITADKYKQRLPEVRDNIRQTVYDDEIKEVNQNLANLRKAQAQLVMPDKPFFDENVNAFKLTKDITDAAERQALQTLSVKGGDANAQGKVKAGQVAKQIFQKYYGVDPTAAQVKLVEETFETYRQVKVERANFESQYDALRDFTQKVYAVQRGESPEETVNLPTRRFPDRFGVAETKPFTITPANADAAEEALRQNHTFEFAVNRKSDPITSAGLVFEGGASSLAPGGQAEDEAFFPRRAGADLNIGNVNYELMREGMSLKTGLSNTELDTVMGTFKSDITETGLRSQALPQEIENEEFRLRNLQKLGELSRPLPSTEFPPGVSSTAPKIDRPAGLSPVFEGGVNGIVGTGGAVLGHSTTLVTFMDSIKVLGSEFSESCFETGSSAAAPTEIFPPPIEPYPFFGQANAVIRAFKISSKDGVFAVEYPGEHEVRMVAGTGFPPGGLTTDFLGRLYSVNMASAEKFGGRIFRFTINSTTGRGQFPLTRELMGAINYYSMMIQLARPANPVALVAGSSYLTQSETGTLVTTNDLYAADFDIIDGRKRILKIYTSLADTKPSYYAESKGNRNHLVGQDIVVDARLQLTGPTDMVMGPDPDNPVAQTGGDKMILISDENTIYAVLRTGASENYTLVPVISQFGRRWSGMAFDKQGRFYFADFERGDIYMMTWDKLRAAVLASKQSGQAFIDDDIRMAQNAYRIAANLVQPGDIELESFSMHPQSVLYVSTYGGVLPLPLPIVGRLNLLQDAVIKRYSVEDKIEKDGIADTFRIVPSKDDLASMRSIVRIKVTDAAGQETWQERSIVLSSTGATILTEAVT